MTGAPWSVKKDPRTWHWNARKLECDRGHRFDVENTYRRADGSRACRKCRRLRQLGRI